MQTEEISAIADEAMSELAWRAEIYRQPSDIPVTPTEWLEHDIEMGDIAGRANARIREIAKKAGMQQCPYIYASQDCVQVLTRTL